MFDFENPFKNAINQAEEEEILDEEFDEATAEPDWKNAEWEEVCGRPSRNAAAGAAEYAEMKATHDKEKQEMFEHFHADRARRRLERMQIDATRYGLAAVLAGVLAYITGTHGISWLAWLLGITGGALAIISSFGFGVVREMSR